MAFEGACESNLNLLGIFYISKLVTVFNIKVIS